MRYSHNRAYAGETTTSATEACLADGKKALSMIRIHAMPPGLGIAPMTNLCMMSQLDENQR